MESSASARRVASAVLVLHDLFGMTFTDIAATVGRTAATIRQRAARACAPNRRAQPSGSRRRAAPARAVHRFPNAAAGGDIQTLVSALDPEVIVRRRARNPGS